MKFWMIAILAGMLSANANGQSSLSGKVTDENGEPLIGANIIIENTFRGSITDLNGNYLLENLEEGSYEIRASYIGHETVRASVQVSGTSKKDFILKETAVMAEEVMIVATRAGQYSPIAHTNVDSEELAERNMGQDIPYLLNLTPSMISSSDAGTGIGYSSFRIRGTDMNRINVTVNGIPLNDSESHGVWWVNMPDFAASVDNVEVQRGVGTSTNGGAAFGAFFGGGHSKV